MSAQNLLFDLPGPRARARHRVLAVVGVLLIAALVAGAVYLLRNELRWAMWRPFIDPVTWTAYLLPGLQATLTAAAISVVTSLVVGLLLGVGRLAAQPVVRAASGVLVEFFRAVPVLMMMVFAYYAFIYSGVLRGQAASLAGVVVGLTLYNGAVIAELVRSGVHALPKGQTEAGLAVGLTPGQTLRSILLPQAIRAMLPALVSQLIVVLKDTALGYLIVYAELLQRSQNLAANYGNIIVAFFVAGVIFVLINWALATLAHRLEAWLSTRQAGHVLHVAEGGAVLTGDETPAVR
ncbi:amino acid ABC transporter permease [Propioniciclava soli]|uniref:Amino acid ABC transporter permease n=1 Tax=Propioniciclava soli TaxID=2775081 RepID=A0ABZ3C7V4_9ACTN|nr:amino acid ABC transporter permease [Propioniciclava soli]